MYREIGRSTPRVRSYGTLIQMKCMHMNVNGVEQKGGGVVECGAA
jgi:hypothetical protein